MIIDNPVNVDLSIGTDRRIIEPGDSQLSVPSILLTTVGGMQAHQVVAPAVSTPQTTSTIVTAAINQTASSAAIQSTIIALSKGLWELEIFMNTSFNYLTTFVIADFAAVLIEYPTAPLSANQLMTHFAVIGNQSAYARFRFLFRSQANIRNQLTATGVAQTSEIRTCINAVRVL